MWVLLLVGKHLPAADSVWLEIKWPVENYTIQCQISQNICITENTSASTECSETNEAHTHTKNK